MKTGEIVFCKRFEIDNCSECPTILHGIILKEDDNFISIKTSRSKYRINKKYIILIKKTTMEFREGDELK